MKKRMTNLLIFASAGAVLHTGSTFADDAQNNARSNAGQTSSDVELRGNINQSAGTHSGDANLRSSLHPKRASDLVGTDIFNQQNEKIGEVKDVVIDLESGRAPFAVISSGGFFGVGNRLLAVPLAAFSNSSANEDSLVLSMDRERLQSAPSFERNSWPDMSDPAWSSRVDSYYGVDSAQSSAATVSSSVSEPAGADYSRSNPNYSSSTIHSDSLPQAYRETTTGLSRDRTPRQGLGAEDLTKNEQKIRNPGGYAESDAFIQTEPAGAGSQTSSRQSGWIKSSSADHQQMGKVRRASELIGMEVDNAQGERVGEIKDVVLDLQSGRVAYTVLSAGGYLGMGDRLFAVPPSLFTRSSTENTLVFNTDKETLRAAPSFEKNDWAQAKNPQFTTDVYRYYNQPIYWQSTSGEVSEPSGSKQNIYRQNGNSSDQQGRGENRDQGSNRQGDVQNDPSGAEPERNQNPTQGQSGEQPPADQSQGSAAKETSELNAASPNNTDAAQEPAGAATATTPATRDDQVSGNADQNLSQRLRTELQKDAQLSSKVQNVQVTATGGRLTLRGSVATEQEKMAVEEKAKQIAGSAEKVDNQLRVQSENP